MQEEVNENFGIDYITIPPKEWIDLIVILEARNDRMHAVYESQKPVSKKKKYEKSGEDDSNS